MMTIDVENNVRRQYNRRVLFCIRVRGATLFIGLWDLFVQSVALFTLILMFGRSTTPPVDTIPFDQELDSSKNLLHDHKDFLSNSVLLDRILKHRMTTTPPPLTLNGKEFYANMDFMIFNGKRTLSQQDQCIIFFMVFISNILTLVHLWGVLINKPSYIIPYFLIKVFNVVVSILSVLGFYSYLPDINGWVRLQSNFPLRHYLIDLDNQTLQLLVFAILLLLVLAKMYIAAIVWYCYSYITALNMARTIGPITIDSYPATNNPIIGQMYSPPKYEDAVKSHPHHSDDDVPPPYTPLLSS